MEIVSINNNILPNELLEAIFFKLPPPDLKKAVSVCRAWRLVGEQTKFWSWVDLTVTDQNLDRMEEAVSIERLKNMKKLNLTAVSAELLEAVYRHPALEVLKARCSFSLVDPTVLGKVFGNLHEVDIGFSDISAQHCQMIFKLANEESKLKKLCLNGIDLSCDSCESKLKKLDRDGIDMSCRSCDDLAGLVVKLEEMNLAHCQLSPHQCQMIFEALRTRSQSKLKSLNMSGNNLFSVKPRTLALVVTRLEEVDLVEAQLNVTQCQLIFTFVSCKSKLKSLKMSGNHNLVKVTERGLQRLYNVTPEALLGLATKLQVFQL